MFYSNFVTEKHLFEILAFGKYCDFEVQLGPLKVTGNDTIR